ncbi:MAG TPA: anti-sigma factor [Nocardioides sp.]|uniref:anti-sigma factor n=1 Tax=Nocardioides sp. TaxID=35761 RepID=UPI002D7E4927|nr:anti-sigma factor [Nocardioides sp.]HET6652015.1 anti-sigma factor [Nocardioides sp.]
MSTDLHTLSGAFAIDALTAEEAEQFRTHLEGCAACREEVRELREAAARMGEVEAVAPPAALKARVLAAADRTAQQPPKVVRLEEREDSGRRRWAPRLAAAAAAAVVVVGGAIGIGQIAGDDGTTLQAGVVRVFEAEDARTAEVDTSQGVVRVATSPGRGEMAVDTSGLRPLDEEHVYQVWSIADGTPSSVVVLPDPDRGASMEMPAAGTQVAITVEPAGGSEQPTTEPIVAVDPGEV